MTGFAICAFPKPAEGAELGQYITRRLVSAPAKGVYARIERFRDLRNRAMNAMNEIGKPRLVFIEGYSYGSSGQAILDLAEFGGLIRTALMGWCGLNLREVPPNTIKQFATEKGAGKKEFIMAHVARRWGQIFQTNDECDAWLLSRMAGVAAGWAKAETMTQRTSVHVAMHGKPK